MKNTTTEQLRRAAQYCAEAAEERAVDALTLIQIKNDPAKAVEQAALAAVQNAYAIQRLIEAQTKGVIHEQI